MSKLSHQERIIRAYLRQEVDYVPCSPNFYEQDYPQRIGLRWQFPFGPSIQEQIDFSVRELDLDMVLVLPFEIEAAPEVTSEVWCNGNTLYKEYSTPSGRIRSAINVDEHWPHGFDVPLFSDYNTSHAAEPWIKSMADVECMRHLLCMPHSESVRRRIEFNLKRMQKLANKYQIATCMNFGMGLTGAGHTFGSLGVCMAAMDDSQMLDSYLEIDHKLNMKMYEYGCEFGVDFVRRNGFCESCDLLSPEILRRHLHKRINAEAALVHSYNKPFAYSMLTGYMPILDYLNDLDIDVLTCPDVFMGNGNAAALKKAIGDSKSFVTGPSDSIQLPLLNPEATRKAVRHIFETFGRKGLILSTCSSSKAVFPWANIEAMIDEWKKLR